MFVDLSYALPAVIHTFTNYGPQIAKIPAVTVKDGVYYVNLRPNTGYLAVNLQFSKAYLVSRIGDLETSDSVCPPGYLAYIHRCINDWLDAQPSSNPVT